MRKIWFDEAWDDYLYWQTQDRKTLKRINMLLRDIERENFCGIGKPEPLKGDMSGFWSRRIDDVNRLVYRISGNVIEIVSYLRKIMTDNLIHEQAERSRRPRIAEAGGILFGF